MSHTIQNFDALAQNELRTDALEIAEAGYAAINVGLALAHKLSIEDDKLHVGGTIHRLAGRRIFFVGVGKCAITAAATIERIFGDRLVGGIALDVSMPEGIHLAKIEACVGTHPLPSETNRDTTQRIVDLLSSCRQDDFVIMLISGGGSTLLCLPEAPMTVDDERALFSGLTARGASIQEINTIRKHTSLARGGWLAQAAYPAGVVSLIVSDVPGNDMGFIASGPTVLDTSTIEDVRSILVRYQITPPETVSFIETPKDPQYFERMTNILFLTNRDALVAMQDEAKRRGYAVIIADDCFTGEARAVAARVQGDLRAAQPRTVLLYAGESTVTLPTDVGGVGGRNQEISLIALNAIQDSELILPFASDGRDDTDHAGAIADTLTRAHAADKNLSIEKALSTFSSYDFFSTAGDALITGYTGSNVSDLIIAMKH